VTPVSNICQSAGEKLVAAAVFTVATNVLATGAGFLLQAVTKSGRNNAQIFVRRLELSRLCFDEPDNFGTFRVVTPS
jgi:hypothetical protein